MTPVRQNADQWHKLVIQPKPITDRIWANLYPKLVLILQSNRQYYERADRKKRRQDRLDRLDELVTEIRKALPPLVQVVPKHPEVNEKAITSNAVGPEAPGWSGVGQDPTVKIDMPFPSMAEILTWAMIKDTIEIDIPLQDLDRRFTKIRERFDQAVIEWRNKVEQDLIDIWWQGQDKNKIKEDDVEPPKPKGKSKAVERATVRRSARKSKEQQSTGQASTSRTQPEPVLPEFIVTFTKPDGTTTTNLSELSPNLQILLRADTRFKAPRSEYAYPGVVPRAALFAVIFGGDDDLKYGERWDATSVTRDNDGSAVARELLNRFGRPDATSAEMKAIGSRFGCGRCDRGWPDSWEQLVSHYAYQQQDWRTAQEKIKEYPNIAFNETHSLGPENKKPSAYLMTPESKFEYMSKRSTQPIEMMACKWCQRIDIAGRYFHITGAEESPIIQHLRDV
ncbi:hypothetical protein FRC09_013636 [Ceratobasidium sp. 395]|nr:hypothetical protein FRC09_013636 [Ceratobasidium sp. 395]